MGAFVRRPGGRFFRGVQLVGIGISVEGHFGFYSARFQGRHVTASLLDRRNMNALGSATSRIGVEIELQENSSEAMPTPQSRKSPRSRIFYTFLFGGGA
jgi:hypothetical protein